MLRVGVPTRFEVDGTDAAAFLAEHMPADLSPRQVLRWHRQIDCDLGRQDRTRENAFRGLARVPANRGGVRLRVIAGPLTHTGTAPPQVARQMLL